MSQADDFLAVAKRFLEALNNNDGDAVREIYGPEARIWHSFHPDGYQSIDENVKTLNWMHRKLPKLHYDLLRLEALADGYLQQHVLRGEMEDGTEVALHACAICTVESGRITRLEEYLDPSQVSALQR
ncbi:nuclear transport factor 2 family protein [Congregibacter sp.]|uniref:nuclear transport factor 2 family protein n=1 Tax=Congregibacter sp. TaxID=2744308 RepID=UPI00385ED3DA